MDDKIKNNEIARHFLELSAIGDSRKAFEMYVGKGFKHHNAYFKGDAETLMLAMEESGEKFPTKVIKILHILNDGDMVAIHSHIKMNPNDSGYALMHIFKFENNKIIELWDFGQQVPEDFENENGMF